MAFLSETDQLLLAVRRRVGDRTRSRIEDHEIVDAANEASARIFQDVLLPADKGYGDYDSTYSYVADQEKYGLPWGFLKLHEAVWLDDDGEKTDSLEIIRRDEKHLRLGMWLDGREFGIAPVPTSNETDELKLYYTRLPMPIHEGIASAAAATTITFAAKPTVGFTLTEDDAYNGARVRCLEGTTGAGEETTITDYEGSTRVATVTAWGTTPTGTIRYEIEPDLPKEAQVYWYLETTLDLVQFRDDILSDVAITRLIAATGRARRSLLQVAHSRWSESVARDDLVIV